VFKYLLISISIAPMVVGVSAARARAGAGDRSALRVSWIVYVILWFGVLYYLRYRWS
jgi:hypothetical protein